MGFPATHEFVGDDAPGFQPCQIVCLQHETSYLYAEVVQMIASRHLCWVRPLVLILRTAETATSEETLGEQLDCYDLRQDSDLLLPPTLFRAALDTEALPWLADFYADDRTSVEQDGACERGRVPFRHFIQQVWQAHTEVFQNRADSNKT
ncbi:MAG: hypothetical protein KME42_09640 [Tildeniella nuda ZEHNDER 1965/U140]|jgi:hypothetical protein|nr:hypothetical protein [Tildeniella nuda ZEHNDER 1965/U140]